MNGYQIQDTDDQSMRNAITDFISVHDKYDITKIDLLKINAIEIMMSIS